MEFISKNKEIIQYNFKSKFHDFGIPMQLYYPLLAYKSLMCPNDWGIATQESRKKYMSIILEVLIRVCQIN